MSYYKNREGDDVIPIPTREVTGSTTATSADSVIVVNGPAVVDPGFEPDEFSAEFTNQSGDRLATPTGAGSTWGIANEWTFMIWVQIQTVSSNRKIFQLQEPSGTENLIDLKWGTSTQGFFVTVGDSTTSSVRKNAKITDLYVPGNWAQIIVTWDGTLGESDRLKAWYNGVQQTLSYTENDSGIVMTDTPRYANFGGPNFVFGGQCHSSALWNVALTNDSAVTTYNGGNGSSFNIGSDGGNYVNSADCVAWWRFGKEGATDPELGEAAIDATTTGTADALVVAGSVVRSAEAPGSSGQVTVTLPDSAASPGKVFTVADKLGSASSLAVLVEPAGSDTLDGATGESIVTARGSKTWVSDGAGVWRNVSNGNPDEAGGAGATGEDGPTGATGPGAAGFAGAMVVKNVDQSITNNATNAVVWQVEEYDVGGWFASSGDEFFTVPSGVTHVRVTANFGWDDHATGRREVGFLRDTGSGLESWPGRPLIRNEASQDSNIGNLQNIVSQVMPVSEGDKIQCSVYQNSGGALDLRATDLTWFSIESVGGVQGATGEVGPTGADADLSGDVTIGGQLGVGDDPGPSFQLDVHGNNIRVVNGANAAAGVFIDSGDDAASQSRIVFRDQGVSKWQIEKNNSNDLCIYDFAELHDVIAINSHADNASAIVVDSGNVGIGAAADASTKLHVRGNSAKFEAESGAFNLIVEGATGQAADVRFRQAGTDEWIWRVDGAGNFVLKDSANNNIIGIINGVTSEAIRIDSQGEVGINDTTPNRQLDVGGTGRFSALLEADGGLDINGNRVNSLGVTTTGINLTVTDEDLVTCTAGSITITLPAVASAGVGRRIIVKDRDGNAGSGNITIDGNASETIDGATTFTMNVNYQSITLVNDGSTWMIV